MHRSRQGPLSTLYVSELALVLVHEGIAGLYVVLNAQVATKEQCMVDMQASMLSWPGLGMWDNKGRS